MNINLRNSSQRWGRVCLWASFNLLSTLTFAQTTPPVVVKGTKTDNNYANTTEINKTKGSSDAQVLAEIEGDYGIGDVVRIVITTPKPTTDPLARSGSGMPSNINMSRPSMPAMPPIGGLPAPQQGTTPPQYTPENDRPIAETPNVNRPNSGSFTPIGNRAVPQGTPQYFDASGRKFSGLPTVSKPTQFFDAQGRPVMVMPKENTPNNGQFTPIANRPAPQQPTKPIVYEYYNSKGQLIPPPTPNNNNNPNRNGDFTPIANRPAPQQTAKPIVYEYYNSKGQLIPPPTTNKPNNNGQMSPIANRPAPQQSTTPPQYSSPNQPFADVPKTGSETPNIGAKAPNMYTATASSIPTKADLSNATIKEQVAGNETVMENSMDAPRDKSERAERSSRSSGGSSSGGGSRASKSSGFSFKNIFSVFGGSGMKTTKRRNMSTRKKYGCYRFN
jgi:hypothetical protein